LPKGFFLRYNKSIRLENRQLIFYNSYARFLEVAQAVGCRLPLSRGGGIMSTFEKIIAAISAAQLLVAIYDVFIK
ncbi:MAG: hypothetical protein IJS69_04405, partial [Selenomonadaceae bacterium]|nr:hypothetical protein [Selenomonadaceae bacterium]